MEPPLELTTEPEDVVDSRFAGARKATMAPAAIGTSADNNSPNKGRKLVVCIDGTSNQFSDKNTNVIELYSRIKKDDSQLTYYNSGIGTYAKPSWRSYTYMKQVLSNLIDLAIAWNLEKVIIAAYRWLADVYKPNDEIYLFGFSRGAYQVRALAAMIKNVGLIYAGNQEQIPFAWELYARTYSGHDTQDSKLETFKRTFSRAVEIHFLGAWDTVSSIGFFRGKLLPLTEQCAHVKCFRHALALDERRVRFLPEHVAEPIYNQTDVREVWFAGTHSDIGGGNKKNSDLDSGDRGAHALIWMMDEAKKAGLNIIDRNVSVQMEYPEVTESLTGFWHVLEWVPMSWQSYRTNENRITKIPRSHWGKGREILAHHRLHWTVLASHSRVIDVGKKAYQPKASLLQSDGVSLAWEALFKHSGNLDDPSESQAAGNIPGWEGDQKLIDTLKIVQAVKEDPTQPDLLPTVFQLTTRPDISDTMWSYGRLGFLEELIAIDKENKSTQVDTAIKSIIGLPRRDDSKSLPKANRDLNPKDDSMTSDTSRISSTVLPRLQELLVACEFPDPSVSSVTPTPRDIFKRRITPSFLRRSTSPKNETNEIVANEHSGDQRPSLRLTQIVVDVVSEVVSKYEDIVYFESGIIEKFPGLIPPNLSGNESRSNQDTSLLQFSVKIVKAISTMSQTSRGQMVFSSSRVVAQRLVAFLQLRRPIPRLVVEVLSVFRVLLTNSEFRGFLIEYDLGGKLVDLLAASGFINDKKEMLESVLATFAQLTEYSESKMSVLELDTRLFNHLRRLITEQANSLRILSHLIEKDNTRNLLATQDLVSEIVLLLESTNTEIRGASIGLIRVLVGYEKPRTLLIQNKISAAFISLLDPEAPVSEALIAMLTIASYPELLNQALVDRLIEVVEAGNHPDAMGALGEVIAQGTYRIPPNLVRIIGSRMSDSDAKVARSACNVVFSLLKKGGESRQDVVSMGVVEILASLLETACSASSYDHETEGSLPRIETTKIVFDMIKDLSEDSSTRQDLINGGAYALVDRLTDGPVSYELDAVASALIDELQTKFVEIKEELAKNRSPTLGSHELIFPNANVTEANDTSPKQALANHGASALADEEKVGITSNGATSAHASRDNLVGDTAGGPSTDGL